MCLLLERGVEEVVPGVRRARVNARVSKIYLCKDVERRRMNRGPLETFEY